MGAVLRLHGFLGRPHLLAGMMRNARKEAVPSLEQRDCSKGTCIESGPVADDGMTMTKRRSAQTNCCGSKQHCTKQTQQRILAMAFAVLEKNTALHQTQQTILAMLRIRTAATDDWDEKWRTYRIGAGGAAAKVVP